MKYKIIIYILVAFISLTWLFLGYPPKALAGSSTLSLDPITRTINKSDVFPVSIMLSTGGDSINTVTANLIFPPDLLKVTSTDASGSSFPLEFEKSYLNSQGEFRSTRAVPRPGVNGDGILVLKVNFEAIGTGTANVEFAATSATYRNNDLIDNLGTSNGGSYTVNSGDGTNPSATPTLPPGVTPTLTPVATPTPIVVGPGTPTPIIVGPGTPTPTSAVGVPTPIVIGPGTPTPVVIGPGTPTPTTVGPVTSTPTFAPATPTPTRPELPDVGVEVPTIASIFGAGVLLLAGRWLLLALR